MQSKSTSVIVLTGGTSQRFGSDKSRASIDGVTLIARILAAIPSECETIIVGEDPDIVDAGYRVTQESPKGGGPVAGFKAGLEICQSEIVALIATDMPFALTRTLNLINSMTPHDDAVMYIDAKGFLQPLAAVYRVEAVERALALMGNVEGQSMRTLISHLNVREITMSREVAQALLDIDTPEDLERAIATAIHLQDDVQL